MSTNDTFERTHPSYGLVRISRASGGPGGSQLFGSPLAHHYGTIRFSVGPATWSHDSNQDHYRGNLRGEHLEFEMSSAQFADMITSLNVGAGTPCTIRYLAGARVPDPPEYKTEAEQIRDNFQSSTSAFRAKAHAYRAKIEELTSKLPVKIKDQIRIALDVMEDQLGSNVPFVLSQFQEATTRITTAAKAEVDAFVTGVVHATGLETIMGRKLPTLLPSGDSLKADET